MDELQVIERLGIAKSSTIHSFIDYKGKVSIWKYINTLIKFGEVKEVMVHFPKGTKKLYMKNEIYRDYFDQER